MKKTVFLISILGLILCPFALEAFTQVQSCDQIVNPAYPCEAVKSCKDITVGNKYYLLLDNVTSAGTCFQIHAGNWVFDLNGYAVNYAQSESGYGFYDQWSHSDNLEIKNGTISGGPRSYSHSIYFQDSGNDNLLIHDLEIYASGVQSEGVLTNGGNNFVIHDVKVVLDSTKQNPCDHNGGHIKGIGLQNRGGRTEIYNNSIVGKGMLGIGVATCGRWNKYTDGYMLIHDNYVSMWSPVRDGYAISISSNQNGCSDGSRIYNNTIDQISGRGIAVAGWNMGTDYGPGDVEVYNNSIKVKEGADCEYCGSGTAVGFLTRFGAHDLYVHDNYITGTAGHLLVEGTYYQICKLHPEQCPQTEQACKNGYDVNRDGSTTDGLKIHSQYPNGLNNRFENNYIDVVTSNAQFPAMAVYLAGEDADDSSLRPRLTKFKNNTFKSNNHPVRVGYSDGGGYNGFFDSDKIVKGANPLDFKSIIIGDDDAGATGITFLDMLTENGADLYDITFSSCGSCGALFADIKISWTLQVKIEDTFGNPLDGIVYVKKGDATLSSGSTTEGIYKTTLDERSYAGINGASGTILNPYTVTVEYQGTPKSSNPIYMTGPRTEVFRFEGVASEDLTPPEISKGNPSGAIPPGTTETTMSVITNENAQCRYSTGENILFNNKSPNFNDGDGLTHTAVISGLVEGNTYTYYVRCKDDAGNISSKDTTDYSFSFWVGKSSTPDNGTYDSDPNNQQDASRYSVSGGCSLSGGKTNDNLLATLLGFITSIVLLAACLLNRRKEKSDLDINT
jgi:hypothetical protein